MRNQHRNVKKRRRKRKLKLTPTNSSVRLQKLKSRSKSFGKLSKNNYCFNRKKRDSDNRKRNIGKECKKS